MAFRPSSCTSWTENKTKTTIKSEFDTIARCCVGLFFSCHSNIRSLWLKKYIFHSKWNSYEWNSLQNIDDTRNIHSLHHSIDWSIENDQIWRKKFMRIPYKVKNRSLSHQSRLEHQLSYKSICSICLPSFIRFFLPIVPILSQKLSPSFLETGVFGDFGRGDAIFLSLFSKKNSLLLFLSHSLEWQRQFYELSYS